ncbi:MAG: prevent-host-death family protein [Candidatus Aldehydirespiratoraceae bacterium]|jgi:prevent-host-death family protein
MSEVGIRALKQNASAVVADAAAGETVTIADRGRPVARMTAIPRSERTCSMRGVVLDPSVLRSLDALHLATALDLGDDPEGLVTYDDRLADAAEANGVAVVSPC